MYLCIKKTSNRLKPTVEKKLRYCTVVSNEYIRLHRRLNKKKIPAKCMCN